MKRVPVFLLVLLLAAAAGAQVKVVHFKKLQGLLPNLELPGYERGKPSGSTQSAMGISTSEASVIYSAISDAGPEKSIQITISDASFNPYVVMQFTMLGQQYENETDEGYEKSLKVKNTWPGKMGVHTGEYKSCDLEFAVGNRFLVSVKGSGTDDVNFLIRVAESIDLDKLAATVAD